MNWNPFTLIDLVKVNVVIRSVKMDYQIVYDTFFIVFTVWSLRLGPLLPLLLCLKPRNIPHPFPLFQMSVLCISMEN